MPAPMTRQTICRLLFLLLWLFLFEPLLQGLKNWRNRVEGFKTRDSQPGTILRMTAIREKR